MKALAVETPPVGQWHCEIKYDGYRAIALLNDRHAELWSRTPEISRQGFVRLADSLKSGGFISRDHRYEDCVETSLT